MSLTGTQKQKEDHGITSLAVVLQKTTPQYSRTVFLLCDEKMWALMKVTHRSGWVRLIAHDKCIRAPVYPTVTLSQLPV
jgi:hypothetical protein